MLVASCVCWLLIVVRCSCSLFVVRCSLIVARCSLFVDCGSLFVFGCWLSVVGRVLLRLFCALCPLFFVVRLGVCLFVRCSLSVVVLYLLVLC